MLKRRLDAAAQTPGVQAADGAPTVLPGVGEIVHIFCTSEDINNLAYALTVRAAVQEIWLPAARGLVADLAALAREQAGTPMLSRTHDQKLPYEITRLAEDIAGGLMVTMPAESDFKSDLKVTKDGQTTLITCRRKKRALTHQRVQKVVY